MANRIDVKLSREQRTAVRCNENLMLSACPGSGKTRVIISKLSSTLCEVVGTPRAVACITYTNAAVHEIEARLRHHIQPDQENRYEVSTIHSFCLNNIFRLFCHLINGYEQGFKVLTPDSEDFQHHVTAVCSEYGIYDITYREFDEFSRLRLGVAGEPVGDVLAHGIVSSEMARSYWLRIRKAGFVDFAQIIYFSYVLLKKRQEILNYISAKFAWILVDEFQDTTDLQVEILSLIAGKGRTRFMLVGDPFQSIFRFAGARPDLADEFSRRIRARTDIQLSGNFRSSPCIIRHANGLCSRMPRMKAVGHAKDYANEPEWRHGDSVFEVITDYFLPKVQGMSIPVGRTAILAPNWYSLFPLGRQLRKYGIRIVGPGARPYRRNRLFAPLAEKVCGYIVESDPESIGGIERTLFITLLQATGRANFNIFSYRGRVAVYRLLERAKVLQKSVDGGVAWLRAAAHAFSEILIDEEYLTAHESELLSVSVNEMTGDMRSQKVDIANLTIADLGIYASPSAALKLSTIHNAKGREYGAVAMIDLHEGRIPHYLAKSDEEIGEARRLFYVGVTRAEQFLLYVTDGSNYRNAPSRFLCDELEPSLIR